MSGRQRTDGSVYLLRAVGTDFYKLGWGRNPSFRVKELQVGCPHELVIVATRPGDVTMERHMQLQFRRYWVRGEWFKFDDEDLIKKVFMVWNSFSYHEMLEAQRDAEQAEATAVLDSILNGTYNAAQCPSTNASTENESNTATKITTEPLGTSASVSGAS